MGEADGAITTGGTGGAGMFDADDDDGALIGTGVDPDTGFIVLALTQLGQIHGWLAISSVTPTQSK